MTNKEKVWVVLAIIASGATTFAIAEYRKEPSEPPLSQQPVVEEIPEFKGDRAGTITAIEGTTIQVELVPIFGQPASQLMVDSSTIQLIVLTPPTGTGKNPSYATEVPAQLSQFTVGDPVQLRYDTSFPPKLLQVVRAVLPGLY